MAKYMFSLVFLASFVAACEFKARDGTCYGKTLREKFFYLAQNFTNLNHGSFGAVAKPVHEKQMQYFLQQEAFPDTWFRDTMNTKIDNSRQAIADYIRAHVNNVVLVENASSAVNSILRSMQLQKGDKIIRFDTAYNMVVRTLDYLAETIGIEVVVVQVSWPLMGPDEIVKEFETTLRQHPDVKLSVLSHITSFPAIVEPLEDMSKLVRELAPSSMILVDGAHTPGVLPGLNVPSYNVDFYLGNCHKWLYAPKGTAFLWVSPSRLNSSTFPEPTVISSKNAQDFVERYSYTGTRDYTAFAVLPSALEFREFLGGEAQIINYCHNLAVEAGRYLANKWGTGLLVPVTMTGSMVNVILPSRNRTAIEEMQLTLNSTYNIYMVAGPVKAMAHRFVDGKPTAPFSPKGECYEDCAPFYITRLSAQVYLELSDFEVLGDLVPRLLGTDARAEVLKVE